MPIKIVIADDEGLLRAGLAAMLGAEPDLEVVAEVGTGEQAVEETVRRHPDVVLMDVRMPGIGGIEAIRRLRAAHSRAGVLVVTTFDVDDLVADAFEAGAGGFLLKNAPRERLADAVRATARGDTVLDPAITDRLVSTFLARPTPDRAVQDRLGELTERELDVLRQLARGRSNAEVAERLGLSEKTVKSHITRLLSKLGLKSRLQAVVLAYDVGLVRPGRHPD